MGIDWTLAWQITAIAFGFTFFILIILALMVKVASKVIPLIPGKDEPDAKPSNNNVIAGE